LFHRTGEELNQWFLTGDTPAQRGASPYTVYNMESL